MRGGLDDALDKLARRNELRRRAAEEASGAPTAVTEVVEAIAAAVARHPALVVTVGIEGDGEPILLHFHTENGVVQVNADNSLSASAVAPEPAASKHADAEIAEDVYAIPADWPVTIDPGAVTRRLSHDDQDRYGPASTEYEPPSARFFGELSTVEHPYGGFGAKPAAPPVAQPFPPHPLAATPPPQVPEQATQRIDPAKYRAALDQLPRNPAMPLQYHPRPSTAQPEQPGAEPPNRGALPQRGEMPAPLPKPIPLPIERPEETEVAARRLSALLRDDPSLLDLRAD